MPFKLNQEMLIAEINCFARLFEHEKTGAQLLSITNSDENRAFGITFRTIPASSNGIAHIMEHSVLCGSRKYPVKEPFVELIKGSFKTFLNAMTFPDKTCYPVASTNLKDFYNLVNVYLDAVFYPLLNEHTLRQEGWHYELESLEAPLSIKGVVFNEMKGNYSSPDAMIDYEYSQRSLFPDTAYGLDSGGDPDLIPELSYSEFKKFHESYYHPSNAFIWFSGDDPESDRLALLDAWLEPFEAQEVTTLISLQPRWESPRMVTHHFDPGNSSDDKSYLTVNWLLPGEKDPQSSLGFSILSYILTGTPASPLRKGLLDSGLGEDLIGAGYQDGLREAFFSVGMKGIETSNLAKVENRILEILEDLVTDSLDGDTILAAMNTLEFRLREQNTGQFPRGLALMFNALSGWIYDQNPIDEIAFEAPLNAIKHRLADGDHYFEDMIKQDLLLNLHRSTVTLKPDPMQAARRRELEHTKLDTAKSAMSTDDLQAVMNAAQELKRIQNTPDSSQALASLPFLRLSDLEREGKSIPITIFDKGQEGIGGPKILLHEIATNGILYLDLGFNFHALPPDLLPFAGIYGRLLLEMGTMKEDYVKLTQRIGRETGGIRPAAFTSSMAVGGGSAPDKKSGQSALWIFLRAKTLVSSHASLFSILEDLLLQPLLDNRERFRQIIHEEKAGLEAALLPSGHGFVQSRIQARLSEAGWANEQLNGIAQLQFLRRLAEELERDWESVLRKLHTLHQNLVNGSGMLANLTSDAAGLSASAPQLSAFLGSFPSFKPQDHVYPPDLTNKGEGLTIPAQVNYVGEGFNLYESGYELNGSALVASKYLRSTYMWEKVRVQGGAYGGYSLFDPHSGIFSMLSYRDPNLLETLDVYHGAPKFLQSLELPPSELTRAIIGTISDLDTYLLPDAKGWTSMTRHLIGYNDSLRQKLREEVLDTSVADIRYFGERLATALEKSEITVLGSSESISRANKSRPGFLTATQVL